MKLYKFINEDTIEKYNGGFVVVDNRIYTNPKEEVVKQAGYKELEVAEPPTYNPDNEILIVKYVDGEKIILSYAIVKVPTEREETQ